MKGEKNSLCKYTAPKQVKTHIKKNQTCQLDCRESTLIIFTDLKYVIVDI